MIKALRHIVHSVGYSIAGLAFMMKSEISARIELVGVVLAFLWFAVLGRGFFDFLILMMLSCVLFSIEALNTAIEVVVDKLSPERSEFGKTVKDLGSTAVFFLLMAGILYLAAVTADAFDLVRF